MPTIEVRQMARHVDNSNDIIDILISLQSSACRDLCLTSIIGMHTLYVNVTGFHLNSTGVRNTHMLISMQATKATDY